MLNYTPINFKSSNQSNNDEVMSELSLLKNKIVHSQIPDELREKISLQLKRAELSLKWGANLAQLDSLSSYIDWVISLPWYVETTDVLDLKKAKEYMDKTHYGLASTKQRLLEYLSVLILQKKQSALSGEHAPVLFFVGLAGTGKTTFARTVAEALGKQFVRIPFGGLASALDLRGYSRINPEAEPGLVIKALRRTKSKNCVILLDELDRIAPEVKGAAMGVLLELLDPEQNNRFIDHYVDFPFDLSKVIFVAAANNTQNVATAVLDRMEIIQMPSYSDEEKIVIARDYILPKLIVASGLKNISITIAESVWQFIARASGYDPGIRSVQRKVESIVRKISLQVVEKAKTTFSITDGNMKEYVE